MIDSAELADYLLKGPVLIAFDAEHRNSKSEPVSGLMAELPACQRDVARQWYGPVMATCASRPGQAASVKPRVLSKLADMAALMYTMSVQVPILKAHLKGKWIGGQEWRAGNKKRSELISDYR